MWIKREISDIWRSISSQPARILVGPRQCGKSSLLAHAKTSDFKVVTLDDINYRDIANQDPQLFLDQLGNCFILDEAQYAPQVFPEIKRRIDIYKEKLRRGDHPTRPDYWLTGSNRILLDHEVAESLTGRATYFRLHTLSVYELVQSGQAPNLESLVMRGGWPELYVDRNIDCTAYLNDHIDTTLVKDLVRTVGIIKISEFLRFLRLLAGRIGNLFSASEIARDSGVRSVTISEWLSFVERMMYIHVIPAFSSSRNTRLIKAPKVYFSDVSLATRLQGWSNFQTLFVNPQIGAFFENIVLTEIIKTRDNQLKSWEIYHYRTKEKEEIDFIVVTPQAQLAIECKLSSREASRYKAPASAHKHKDFQYVVVSLDGGPSARESQHVSLFELRNFLLMNLQ